MNQKDNSKTQAQKGSSESMHDAWALQKGIRCPGLSLETTALHGQVEDFFKRLAAHYYKQEAPHLWVVLLGGTGTGKSTLFNSLCGESLSETGVERPKTCGPIVYVNRRNPVNDPFPFPSVRMMRHGMDAHPSKPACGIPGQIFIMEHDHGHLSHMVFVDTPDLDSLEPENRQLAADLYLMADVVVFVASQEKYADEVPSQFLLRAIREERPYYILINKAEPGFTVRDVIGMLESQGVSAGESRLWLVPFAQMDPIQTISKDSSFLHFKETLLAEVTLEKAADFRAGRSIARNLDLEQRLDHLLELLQSETRASKQWLHRLEELTEKTGRALIDTQKEKLSNLSRDYLQEEIRKLYRKYDVLAGPRKIVREVILTPLRFLGLYRQDNRAAQNEALLRVRQKMDPVAIRAAVERLNRTVLAELSPSEEAAPLFAVLRRSGTVLTDKELDNHILEEQDRLTKWLEKTFEELSRTIPKGKKWGIYSTSILWGLLLITFETMVGGGLTLVEAALDTAIAPFLTKGAVELFAYREIQKVARDLAGRYEKGLVALIRQQSERYRHCLEQLSVSEETMKRLLALQTAITNEKQQK